MKSTSTKFCVTNSHEGERARCGAPRRSRSRPDGGHRPARPHERRRRGSVPKMLAVILLTPLGLLSVQKPSILITDGLDRAAISLLTSAGAEVVEQHLTLEELNGDGLKGHDAVIIRSATSLSAAAIQSGTSGKLRVIGRAGVGVDNVDTDAAAAAGCYVLNTPGASTRSVAELTLGHMLAAARGLQAADTGLKSGRWLKGKIKLNADGGPRQGHELAGKRLGILGFGKIAQEVALLGSALGMDVCAFSRGPDEAKAASMGVELMPSVAALLSACTHVVVLSALTEETRGLIDRNKMDLMAQRGADGTPCGAHLFNMARGGIVVETDAAAALLDGTLAVRCPPLPPCQAAHQPSSRPSSFRCQPRWRSNHSYADICNRCFRAGAPVSRQCAAGLRQLPRNAPHRRRDPGSPGEGGRDYCAQRAGCTPWGSAKLGRRCSHCTRGRVKCVGYGIGAQHC